MSPVIKIGGNKAKGTAAKAKPAASRKTTTKRTAAKPAAKRTTAAKKTTGSKPKRATAAATTARKPRTPKIDPKILTRHEKALKAAGDKRAKAEEAHNDAVDGVHKAATEALAAGVPMSIVSDTLGISRQWLYKMGSFRDRTNGHGPAKKAAAKKPAAKKTGTTRRPRVRAK